MPESDLQINNFVVAFIDILGQRDQFRNCGLVPANRDEVIFVARKTIAVVRNLHQHFDKFYESLLVSAKKEMPDVPQAEHEKLQNIALKHQRFSDGLVLYLSLFGEIRPEVLNSIFGLLASSGSLCLISLIQHAPIRGGIDVAWGVELRDNELYGCALAKAFELEHEIAGYPRIVVGEHLLGYLIQARNMQSNGAHGRYVRAMASMCLELLGQDADGAIIVDFLGPGFKKYVAATIDDKAYRVALSFVVEQIKYWKSEENTKLLRRYIMLNDYFARNRELWIGGGV